MAVTNVNNTFERIASLLVQGEQINEANLASFGIGELNNNSERLLILLAAVIQNLPAKVIPNVSTFSELPNGYRGLAIVADDPATAHNSNVYLIDDGLQVPLINADKCTDANIRSLPERLVKAQRTFWMQDEGMEGFWRYNSSLNDSNCADNTGTYRKTVWGGYLERVIGTEIFPEWFKQIGEADFTNAFQRCFSFINLSTGVFIPADGELNDSLQYTIILSANKTYEYSGTNPIVIQNANVALLGKGVQSTRIKINTNTYFLQKNNGLGQLDIKGIKFVGGKGAFIHTYTSANVLNMYSIKNCGFYSYSECALGFNSVDMPYLEVRNNIFKGTNTSIGVCCPGDCATSVLNNNKFLKNKFHLKLQDGGRGLNITENDFIRWDTAQCIDIWIVPRQNLLSGNYLNISDNKFGNENLQTSDPRILIAEQTGIGLFSTNTNPSYTTSTGTIASGKITDNIFYGVDNYQKTIVSYTSDIRDYKIDNVLSGTFPNVFFSIESSDIGDNRLNRHNQIQIRLTEGTSALPPVICNVKDVFHHIDIQDYDNSQRQILQIFPLNLINPYPDGLDSTIVVEDSKGGNSAVECTTHSIYGGINTIIGDCSAGVPLTIEFDLKKSSGNSCDVLGISINKSDVANTQIFSRKTRISDNWQKFSYTLIPRESGILKFEIRTYEYTSVKNKFQFGRFAAYQGEAKGSLKTMLIGQNLFLTDIKNESAPAYNQGMTIFAKGETVKYRTATKENIISPISDIVTLISGYYEVSIPNITSNAICSISVQNRAGLEDHYYYYVSDSKLKIQAKDSSNNNVSSSSQITYCITKL